MVQMSFLLKARSFINNHLIEPACHRWHRNPIQWSSGERRRREREREREILSLSHQRIYTTKEKIAELNLGRCRKYWRCGRWGGSIESSGKETDEGLAVKQTMYIWQITQSPCPLLPPETIWSIILWVMTMGRGENNASQIRKHFCGQRLKLTV